VCTDTEDLAEKVEWYHWWQGRLRACYRPAPEVNALVNFVVQPASFDTTTHATGCPGGSAGKFFFQATLRNNSEVH
jgi:hypothetical protein